MPFFFGAPIELTAQCRSRLVWGEDEVGRPRREREGGEGGTTGLGVRRSSGWSLGQEDILLLLLLPIADAAVGSPGGGAATGALEESSPCNRSAEDGGTVLCGSCPVEQEELLCTQRVAPQRCSMGDSRRSTKR